MSPRRVRLETRLLVVQVVVFGSLLVAAIPAGFLIMSHALHRDRDLYLETLARGFAADLARVPLLRDQSGPPAPCLSRAIPPESPAPDAAHTPRHLLVWDGARVLCSDGEVAPLAIEAAATALAEGAPRYADVRWSAEVLRLLEWPVTTPDGRTVVVEVGTSFRVIEGVIARGVVIAGATEALAVILVVAGSWLLARRAFAPIDRIVDRVERIDEGSLGERLADEPGEDQAARLVAVINHMLERLERAFEAQSRFSSDVAHEIRSPLTALRGQIEVALRRERTKAEYREVLGDSLEEVLRLQRLAEDLMSLARADAGELLLQRSELELGEILATVRRRCRGAAAAKDLEIRLDTPQPVVVHGDRVLIERMVENLLDNAIIHSPRLESVELGTRPTERGAELWVADHGTGIAAEHLPRLFDRFYRVDPARSRLLGGTGLGLAIVQRVATLHGGSVAVRSAPGEGSVFTVSLPADARAADVKTI